MGEERARMSHLESDPFSLARFLRQALILATMMLVSLGLYLSVEWWRGLDATLETQLEWDRMIPFHVEWVWVYLIPYLIGPLAVGLLSRDTFSWYIRRGILVVVISLVIFALLPTRTVRPDVAHLGAGVTADLYRNMIAIDGPAANAAPSLHVSLTAVLAFALMRDFPRWWLLSLAGVGVVWLSTLFTHQHHLVDVASGVLLAGVMTLPRGRTSDAPAARR